MLLKFLHLSEFIELLHFLIAFLVTFGFLLRLLKNVNHKFDALIMIN